MKTQYWTHTFIIGFTALALHAGVPFNDLQGSGGIGYNPIAYTAGRYNNTGTNGINDVISLPQVGVWYVDFFESKLDWVSLSSSISIARRLELSYAYGLIRGVGGDDTINTHTLGAKFNLIPENSWETTWVPAISVGARWKYTDTDLAKILGLHSQGADFYAVATKLITQTPLPVLLSAGVQASDDLVYGVLGHNKYGASGFGSVSVLPLSNVAVGVEIKQGVDIGENSSGVGFKNADYLNAHVGWLVNDRLSLIAAYGFTGDKDGGTDNFGLGQAVVASVQYGF